MAITAKQLLEHPELLEKLRTTGIGRCVICQQPITGIHPDEVRMVRDGPVHDDCYFEEMGNEVEKHPIRSPRVRRG